ncbi:hypothetical protein Ancab_029604 [Ancistrocladus abbreviatus]
MGQILSKNQRDSSSTKLESIIKLGDGQPMAIAIVSPLNHLKKAKGFVPSYGLVEVASEKAEVRSVVGLVDGNDCNVNKEEIGLIRLIVEVLLAMDRSLVRLAPNKKSLL